MKYNYTDTVYDGFRLSSEMGESATRSTPNVYFDIYDDATTDTWQTRMQFISSGGTQFNTPSRALALDIQDTVTECNSDLHINTGYGLSLDDDDASKPSTNTWTISSDERLKEGIVDLPSKQALATINQIKVRQFKYIKDFRDKHGLSDEVKVGVVAQELEKVSGLQCCVITKSDEVFYDTVEEKEVIEGIDEDGNKVSRDRVKKVKKERYRIKDRKQVNLDRVSYMLISAVQELSRQNKYLVSKVKELQDAQKGMWSKLNQLETSHEQSTGNNVFDSASYKGTTVDDNMSYIG